MPEPATSTCHSPNSYQQVTCPQCLRLISIASTRMCWNDPGKLWTVWTCLCDFGTLLVTMKRIDALLMADQMWFYCAFQLPVQRHWGIASKCGIQKLRDFAHKHRLYWLVARMIWGTCIEMKHTFRHLMIAGDENNIYIFIFAIFAIFN